MRRLRARVWSLYHGDSPGARLFRWSLLAFDLILIVFFVGLSFMDPGPWIVPVDFALAAVLAVDFGLRFWVAGRPLAFMLRASSLADLIVIVSLMLPALTESYVFLRVLRALRVMRSYHVLGELCRHSDWVRRNREAVEAVLNLVVFVFVVTALVYVTQARRNPEIHDYVDALYFTVTTLSTTGFGDITLVGQGGRLLSVLIMIFGISLFVRLAQALFRPSKVRYPCPVCGLQRHDPDAVHCKHCGNILNIPDEGA